MEKSGLIAWIRGLGAVSNIILNFLFIPKYGIVGAAGATCISFILMALILYLINLRIFSIPYNWNKIGLITFTTGLIFFIHFNFHLDLYMKIILSFSYPIILIITDVVRVNQFQTVLNN